MIDDHSHQITHIIPPTFNNNNNNNDDHSSSSSINLNPNELPDVSDLCINLPSSSLLLLLLLISSLY